MKRALVFAALIACGGRTNLAHGVGGDAGHNSSCGDAIIAKDSRGATHLALDGDAVFWGTSDGLVEKNEGAGATTLVTEITGIDAVAVDATHVYYTTAGELRSVPRAGGAATTIAVDLGQPLALTRDPSDGAFFLLDYGSGIAAGRALRVEPNGTVTELMTGLDVPKDIVIDDAAAYVASNAVLISGQLLQGVLLRIPKAGGVGATLASGLHEPAGVAVDASRVYFVEQVDAQSTLHGGLRSIPKTGGAVTSLADTPDVAPLDVVVDGSFAYVTTYSVATGQGQGALLRVAVDGSSTSELAATPSANYNYVRTSAAAVYWAIDWLADHPPADGASVRKLCK